MMRKSMDAPDKPGHVGMRGSALLSALFIMTLVAIATTTLTLQIRHHIAETELIASSHAQREVGNAARLMAMNSLLDKKYEAFGRAPNTPPIRYDRLTIDGVPGAFFSIEVSDLNQFLNLNDLNQSSVKTAFYRLVKHLTEDEKGKASFALTTALSNWVSPHKSGYSPDKNQVVAHTPLVSLTELNFIHELDSKTRKIILPYITILPRGAPMNINTVPDEILMGFAQTNAAMKALESILSLREENRIESLNDITELLNKLSLNKNMLTTESQYFLSKATIINASNELTLYSLIERVKNKEDNRYSVHLIHETWNAN